MQKGQTTFQAGPECPDTRMSAPEPCTLHSAARPPFMQPPYLQLHSDKPLPPSIPPPCRPGCSPCNFTPPPLPPLRPHPSHLSHCTLGQFTPPPPPPPPHPPLMLVGIPRPLAGLYLPPPRPQHTHTHTPCTHMSEPSLLLLGTPDRSSGPPLLLLPHAMQTKGNLGRGRTRVEPSCSI